jgi:YhcH/YjgK/YiaL family protein
MIVDKIANWSVYFNKERFAKIFEELNKFNLETPNGEYRINEHFYFKVMSYETKLESFIIESHRREVDIQILLTGKEKIKIYDSKDVVITEVYNEETDCQFYKKVNDPILEVNLEPGFMAVFFADDIHHPILAVNKETHKLKKIVIKVDEKFFAHQQ